LDSYRDLDNDGNKLGTPKTPKIDELDMASD